MHRDASATGLAQDSMCLPVLNTDGFHCIDSCSVLRQDKHAHEPVATVQLREDSRMVMPSAYTTQRA